MERSRGRLSSYDAHVGIFPSKTDRIMSRYRRIAPKPTAPCASDADKSASSALSFDNLSVRPAPISSIGPSVKQKMKRVRKRRSKESYTSESSKRLATLGRVPNSAEIGVSRVSAAGAAAPLSIQEDVGFMKRAAASAPSSVFPLEKARKTLSSNAFGFGGCFTEMIRGIAGLPSAAHVQSLLHQQPAHVQSLLHQQQQSLQGANLLSVLTQEPPKQLVDDVGPPGRARLSEDYARREDRSDTVCLSFLWGRSPTENADCCVSEEQQQSGLDELNSDGEEDDGRRRAATLNLLPDAPSRKESPSMLTCTSSWQISEQGNSACGNSLLYVEQMYGKSSEPVVLVDDLSCTVLWENQGFLKACKDDSGAPATSIDLLGIPTQLRKLQIQLDGQSECVSATLWGFLRKLVVDLGDREASRERPRQANPSSERTKEAEVSSTYSLQQQNCHGMSRGNLSAASTMSFDSLVSPGVITPQPVRLVGSVVSLESITEVQTRGTAMVSIELAKKQLKGSSLPGFLTDAAWVVRWVNSAYKAMVGQPECPWLTSTTMNMGDESPTITGEVLLSCNVEVPLSVTSFSGRANVQWTRNTGERSCMTVPCDVSSLADGHSRRMLMWSLDIQASLSLNCRLQR